MNEPLRFKPVTITADDLRRRQNVVDDLMRRIAAAHLAEIRLDKTPPPD